MGVYVKGMEMPVCCTDCPFEAGTTYVCRLTSMMTEKDHQRNVKPVWCPLVEVKTPHDRLIDAGVYKKLLADDSKLFVLEHTPTVIEAEDE